jgi:outer membrane immunogenic protein
MNVAGFGDTLRSTGPLGGMNFNINWQTDQMVYGVGASLSGADIRGENTLFSGLGGVNGQTVTGYIGTLVGKLGVACERSLFYVDAGPALLNTTFKINANTGVLTLGTDSQTINAWGWTAGVGVEYALTDHLSSSVEYNYIRIPRHTISLSSIELINQQLIAADQTMNVYKVGLNYKFNLFG